MIEAAAARRVGRNKEPRVIAHLAGRGGVEVVVGGAGRAHRAARACCAGRRVCASRASQARGVVVVIVIDGASWAVGANTVAGGSGLLSPHLPRGTASDERADAITGDAGSRGLVLRRKRADSQRSAEASRDVAIEIGATVAATSVWSVMEEKHGSVARTAEIRIVCASVAGRVARETKEVERV